MAGADLRASFVAWGTDGDSNGEFPAVRDRKWFSAPTPEALSEPLSEAFSKSLLGPGTAAEVDTVISGGTALWHPGMEDANSGHEVLRAIAASLRHRLPAAPGLSFSAGKLRAEWLPTDGNPVRARYDNPPTVVVMAVAAPKGLVMVRRGLREGYGRLALPGGHQVMGETWQEAGVREMEEETGLVLDPSKVVLDRLVTVPSGHNLAFARYDGRVDDFAPRADKETLEVRFETSAVEAAFPTHTDAVRRFFGG